MIEMGTNFTSTVVHIQSPKNSNRSRWIIIIEQTIIKMYLKYHEQVISNEMYDVKLLSENEFND